MALEDNLLPADYLPLLDELNTIVINSGEPLEGNLFYYHHHSVPPSRDSVYSEIAQKRSNFATACKASTLLLEVGFNAGHSALLALANDVFYHGVDDCTHAYSRPAAMFLKEKFPDRFHLYPGDSREVLPRIHESFPALYFDLIHIDGNQSIDFVRADTYNSLRMALNNAWLILDDTNVKDILNFYKDLIIDKTVVPDHPAGWKYYWTHTISRISFDRKA